MIIDFLKKHEKQSIFVSILMVLISILLIFKPNEFLLIGTCIFGSATIIEGFIRIFGYAFLPKEEKIYSYDIMEGIFSILTGFLILFLKQEIISIFPILIAVWIVIKSILKIQFAFQLKSMEESSWIGVCILGIISLILGFVIFFNPWSTVITFTVLAGIILLITQLVEIFSNVYWLYHFREM